MIKSKFINIDERFGELEIIFFSFFFLAFFIVFCCHLLFYSKQSGWNIFTTFVIMAFLSVFCLINGLYSRIADLSSHNQKCARLILQRIARTQWSLMNVDEKKVQLPKRYSDRYLINLSLFAQTMTNNRYGFTYGQVFYITKFRYIQLFIMNFILILKFYKKTCR